MTWRAEEASGLDPFRGPVDLTGPLARSACFRLLSSPPAKRKDIYCKENPLSCCVDGWIAKTHRCKKLQILLCEGFYLISVIFSLTFRASAILGFVCFWSIMLLVYVELFDILLWKKKVSAAESNKTFWSDNEIIFICLSIPIDMALLISSPKWKIKVVH